MTTYCVSPAGKSPAGCAAFRLISPNVELEESGIKEDKEQSEEQTYTQVRGEDMGERRLFPGMNETASNGKLCGA